MTDMVGSTRQWEADWQGMWKATQRHDAIADQVISDHGGRILKPRGEGDSLLVLFPNVSQAILGAIQLNLAREAQTQGASSTLRDFLPIVRKSTTTDTIHL
jgi:class 3 adenylate cyclase